MKRQLSYFVVLLLAFFPWVKAAQAQAVPTDAAPLQSDCRKMSDNRVVNASTSLRVTVVSCSDGVRIVADRKVGNASVETVSRRFTLPNAGVNEVGAVSKDAFYVNFLEANSYANPSIRIYSFYFHGNQWLLRDMSFQATQSCNGEAGVDADYYDVDYQAGKVEEKEYTGCDHFKKRRLTIKPVSIPLGDFDASDERLSPFRFE